MKYRELRKLAMARGFVHTGCGPSSSHRKFVHPSGEYVIILNDRFDVTPGVERDVLRRLGISKKELRTGLPNLMKV